MGEAQKQDRKAFIVDAPATMLKRNSSISRNARILYNAMRALADGKTGELKIPPGRGPDPETYGLKLPPSTMLRRCAGT